MNFDFACGRIVFGWGSVSRLPELAKPIGTKALLVTGSQPERSARHVDLPHALFEVHGEPTLELVRQGVKAARNGCDFVIGFGGGSAIDAAKTIAVLTTNSGEPLDYLEVIGKGQALQSPPLPTIAIPTTSGTGAEVTRNSVLGSPEHGLKASLRGPFLQPAIALVDPALTVSLPPETTATTGLDALTQLLEAFVSAKANSFTDTLCREGLRKVRTALKQSYENGADQTAREDMSYASLLSGLALANAGLGVVHGFAAPLGGLLKASHGSICAAVLVAGTAANIRALEQRAPNHASLLKYDEAAQLVTGSANSRRGSLLDWLWQLTHDLNVRPLGQLGLETGQLGDLVEKAGRANSMKANPIALTTEELETVAKQSF